ncbi:hypothetical protein [Shewanella sp.]|uniref:hypothetical protein n=1 Tax=Shewanella sp. TaxID=50422 RepID=UPI0040546735
MAIVLASEEVCTGVVIGAVIGVVMGAAVDILAWLSLLQAEVSGISSNNVATPKVSLSERLILLKGIELSLVLMNESYKDD